MDGHVNDTLDEREEMGTMDAYKSRYSGQDKGTMDERDHMDAHTIYTHISMDEGDHVDAHTFA